MPQFCADRALVVVGHFRLCGHYGRSAHRARHAGQRNEAAASLNVVFDGDSGQRGRSGEARDETLGRLDGQARATEEGAGRAEAGCLCLADRGEVHGCFVRQPGAGRLGSLPRPRQGPQSAIRQDLCVAGLFAGGTFQLALLVPSETILGTLRPLPLIVARRTACSKMSLHFGSAGNGRGQVRCVGIGAIQIPSTVSLQPPVPGEARGAERRAAPSGSGPHSSRRRRPGRQGLPSEVGSSESARRGGAWRDS